MKRQNPDKNRIAIGITGSFGSGKTAVARIFNSFGARVINADRVAHRVIAPGTKIYKKIINTFGKDIIQKNRAIDREKLAEIVFNNKKLLKKLNKITHPEIIKTIKKDINTSPQRFIVLDAPLLIEAGLSKIVDKLIVVKINKEKQIERIIKKSSLKKIDILKRIKAQIPLKDKVRMADFVIDNSKTLNKTKKQVKQIIRRLEWKN